jgi:hypothetical protein
MEAFGQCWVTLQSLYDDDAAATGKPIGMTDVPDGGR